MIIMTLTILPIEKRTQDRKPDIVATDKGSGREE